MAAALYQVPRAPGRRAVCSGLASERSAVLGCRERYSIPGTLSSGAFAPQVKSLHVTGKEEGSGRATARSQSVAVQVCIVANPGRGKTAEGARASGGRTRLRKGHCSLQNVCDSTQRSDGQGCWTY